MFETVKAVFRLRWKYTIRYSGWFIVSIIIPIFFAILPIVLGWAVAGSPQNAALNFKTRVGTDQYTLYMLLGSGAWMLSIMVMWDFGMWIREEQQMGTLEQLLLTPANMFTVLLGSVLFQTVISLVQFAAILIVGGLVFNVLDVLLSPSVVLAVVYLFLGIFPLTGFAMMIGGLVVKIKEAEGVIRLLQPFIAFLIGIFYPITMMPYFIRMIAIVIPLTISLQDMRAVLLHLEYVFNPYLDILILLVYTALWPMVGLSVYSFVEKRAKKEGTIGGY